MNPCRPGSRALADPLPRLPSRRQKKNAGCFGHSRRFPAHCGIFRKKTGLTFGSRGNVKPATAPSGPATKVRGRV